MKSARLPVLLAAFCFLLQHAYAQKEKTKTTTTLSLAMTDSTIFNKTDSVPPPVITHHNITLDGKIMAYTASTGYMSMKDEEGKVMAKIFFVAYSKDGSESDQKRPVTFVFNGGPGSASIWLHMGALSPVRVNFANDKGDAPKPPYSYSDNTDSWLSFTDLIFIDPVSTGYSRPAKGIEASKYHGYTEDIQSVGDFIRLYITRYKRWTNPKFIAGESYGTTRAAGLSGYLTDAGIYLNGITLISSVLNFQLIDFHHGNEMPYIFFLPTYTATAQYYKKLSPALQNMSIEELTKRSEAFAKGIYTSFLMEGSAAGDMLTNKVIDSLNYFTGLSKEYIRRSNCRIADYRFFKELLRDEGKTVGRYDSRFAGEDADDAGETPEYDPSYASINGLFTSVFNQYVRIGLGYKNDIPYNTLTSVWPWNYKPAVNSYLDVSETLRSAMTQNPQMKVMICCGYYDLATPTYNAEYVVSHIGLRPDVRNNISLTYYKAGHMIYVTRQENDKFKLDADKFYSDAIR